MNYSDLQNDVRKTLALNLLENETLALARDRLFARLLRSQRVQSRLPALGRPIAGRLSPTTRGHFKSAAAKKSEPPARDRLNDRSSAFSI